MEGQKINIAYRALLKAAKSSLAPDDNLKIRRALDLALKACKGNSTLTGQPEILHSLSVATIIAEEMGCKVITAYDVGIAGVHRLFGPLKLMIKEGVDVLIVIAGMEGALPAVIAGLVDLPVIGVPTSTSYGYGEKGIGALTTMLQSCSLGLAVVNIDNGVAAGSIAALIAKRVRS